MRYTLQTAIDCSSFRYSRLARNMYYVRDAGNWSILYSRPIYIHLCIIRFGTPHFCKHIRIIQHYRSTQYCKYFIENIHSFNSSKWKIWENIYINRDMKFTLFYFLSWELKVKLINSKLRDLYKYLEIFFICQLKYTIWLLKIF